jgi:hypothetical protein
MHATLLAPIKIQSPAGSMNINGTRNHEKTDEYTSAISPEHFSKPN